MSPSLVFLPHQLHISGLTVNPQSISKLQTLQFTCTIINASLRILDNLSLFLFPPTLSIYICNISLTAFLSHNSNDSVIFKKSFYLKAFGAEDSA